MVQRTARKGPKSGLAFWGCSSYPDCKGTLPVTSTKKSDKSDMSDGSDKSDKR